MAAVGWRACELLLLGIACFFLIPPVSSTPEPYDLMPGFAFAGTAYFASLALAYRRGAENVATTLVKFVGLLVFGYAIYLRCLFG
jgi:hypothetical protein